MIASATPPQFSLRTERRMVAKQVTSRRVSLRPGKGWLRRNFITEVYLPSLFVRRRGAALRPQFPALTADQVCLTWIGHASFLVTWRGLNILIDPIWSLWLKVIKRLRHPGIRLDHLPDIDLVLVTHAHFDHLDRRTFRKVAAAHAILFPEGVGALLENLTFNQVHHINHYESP